jgi:hypothetical protein
MIFPPVDLNEAIFKAAALLEMHLEATFPGYLFEVLNLNFVEPADPDEPVMFGDGTRFTAIPIMGTINADRSAPIGDLTEPPRDLYEQIVETCYAFDVEAFRRRAA